MSLEFLIRQATQDDIPEILRHRRAMYEAMDYNDEAALSGHVVHVRTVFDRSPGKRLVPELAGTRGSTRRGWRSSPDQPMAEPSLRSGMPPSHDPQRLCVPGFSSKRRRPPVDGSHDRLVPKRKLRRSLAARQQRRQAPVRRARLRTNHRDAAEAERN